MQQKDSALKAGISLAREKGLINITRADISTAIGIRDGSWTHSVGVSFSSLVAEIKEAIGDEKYSPVSKKRVSPVLRKENILLCAIKLAEVSGYTKVTATAVAEEAGVSHPMVSHYFGTMVQLRTDIMRRAVKSGNLKIIAQGLANGDIHAKKADQKVKEDALKCLI